MNYRQRKRKRKQERLPCNITVMINDSLACEAFDIGEGGMYMLTDQPFKLGTILKISLFYGDEKIEIQSKVKYCHKGVGIGIMFIDLDNELKDKIKGFINNIKQLT